MRRLGRVPCRIPRCRYPPAGPPPSSHATANAPEAGRCGRNRPRNLRRTGAQAWPAAWPRSPAAGAGSGHGKRRRAAPWTHGLPGTRGHRGPTTRQHKRLPRRRRPPALRSRPAAPRAWPRSRGCGPGGGRRARGCRRATAAGAQATRPRSAPSSHPAHRAPAPAVYGRPPSARHWRGGGPRRARGGTRRCRPSSTPPTTSGSAP
mmetsp:Transcript_30413/g.77826  ORF Transcript_30413/g.77826 Transcript_30413/m.77826 type:complete len:205 (+) Transcript_30413:435-1049(+)